MLSGKDVDTLVNKFKDVFATKSDLHAVEKRASQRFATKKDLDTMADRFMKVFATKQEVREIVREELEPVHKTNQKILTVVEGLASRMEREELSNAARDAQLARHDGWIKHIAKETKVKLAK